MQQNAANTIRIPAIKDETLIGFFNDLVKDFAPSEFNVDLPNQGLGTWNNRAAFDARYKDLDWHHSRAISSGWAKLFGGTLQIHFHRFIVDFGEGRQRQLPSMWENEFVVERHGEVPPEQFLKVLAAIERLRATSTANMSGALPGVEMRDLAASQFSQLSDLHTRIVHDAENSRLRAEERFAERQAQLEAEYSQKRSASEEEMQTRRNALAAEEEKLNARKKDLDDRGHMHARREQSAQLTSALKQRLEKPSVSKNARNLQRFISALSLFAIFAFGVSAFVAGLDMHVAMFGASISYPVLAIAGVRFALSVAAAAGVLFYILGWWRKIHAEELRSERDLERYRFDIERASWVAETLLEAKTADGTVIPGQWITGATNNLFARAEVRDDDDAALHAVAALLGVSARAEMGTNGVKVELNKNGLGKLGRAAD